MLFRSCLAKDPDDRWQSARDLKAELEWIAIASPSTTAAPRHMLLPWIAAALLATITAAVFGTGYYRATRPAPPKPLVRLDLNLPVDATSGARVGPSAILSADGTRLVYISQGKLFTRKLDQTNATELAGTEDAFLPFFSPDGQWVAFFANGKLRKISVEGGAPIALCDVSTARGGSWGEDGSIILTVSSFSGLSLISPTGGAPTSITERSSGEVTHRWQIGRAHV